MEDMSDTVGMTEQANEAMRQLIEIEEKKLQTIGAKGSKITKQRIIEKALIMLLAYEQKRVTKMG